jgi:hypothetical protein
MPDAGGSVQFVGAEAAALSMQLWSTSLPEKLEPRIEGFAGTVIDKAATIVPVVSGTLVGSLAVVEVDDGVGVSIGEGVPYAGWIEFGGSRGRDAVPEGRYLYPTALDAETEFGNRLRTDSQATVRSHPWPTPL